MMISSQLTKFRKKSLGWSVRGFFSWAKRKVAWTGRWSKAPVLWWPGNGKKHQSFWHKFAGTHFVWLVGDSYARTSSWTLDLKIRYFFGFPSYFWHHRNSSHLSARRFRRNRLECEDLGTLRIGEAANANSRNAKTGSLKKKPFVWTKIEQNNIDSPCCWTESCTGDIPNPMGSSRFLCVPIFMHQQSYPLRLFLLDSAHVNHAPLAQLHSFSGSVVVQLNHKHSGITWALHPEHHHETSSYSEKCHPLNLEGSL